MNFHIGQKVACIGLLESEKLTKGEVCLIDDIMPSTRWPGEVVLHISGYGPWFRTTRFRPLVEKSTETGMAILNKILDRETIKDQPPVKKPKKEIV